MLVKGSLVSEFSGKLGGMVGSHNRGGQYLRQFRVPTNPNTALQQERRTAFGTVAIAWRETLTQAQRDAWDAIAGTITAVNRLGDPITLNGQQAYQKAATLAALAGLAAPATAPGATGETPTGTIGINELGANIDLDVDGAPPWAADDDGRLLVFLGRAVSVATTFYKGPFQFAGTVSGNTAAPVTDGTINVPAGNTQLVAGLRHFIRVLPYLDGRTGQPQIISAIAV